MQVDPSAHHGATVADVMVSAHPTVRGLQMASPRPDPFDGLRISARAPLSEAARLMLRTGSWMLVVVDDRNELVGMLVRDQLSPPRRSHRRRGATHTGRPSVLTPA